MSTSQQQKRETIRLWLQQRIQPKQRFTYPTATSSNFYQNESYQATTSSDNSLSTALISFSANSKQDSVFPSEKIHQAQTRRVLAARRLLHPIIRKTQQRQQPSLITDSQRTTTKTINRCDLFLEFLAQKNTMFVKRKIHVNLHSLNSTKKCESKVMRTDNYTKPFQPSFETMHSAITLKTTDSTAIPYVYSDSDIFIDFPERTQSRHLKVYSADNDRSTTKEQQHRSIEFMLKKLKSTHQRIVRNVPNQQLRIR
jgi:hypothetical protein